MSALEDVRVVDLSTGIAGPLAAMCLADFGADVVKVETPAGDPARALPGFAVWNRGKRAVVADPADEGRRRWLREMLAGADVCVVGEGEALEAYELDPEALARANPGLVLLRTPPYHGRTPWHGGKESHGLLAAATGAALRQSSFEGGPIEFVYPLLLYIQGIWAATCAVAALIERQGSGFGQTVTVSGVNGMMEACAGAMAIDPALPDPPTANGPGGPSPCYSRYRCRDGRWLFVGALTPKFQTWLLEELGLSGMLDDERLAGSLERILLPGNRGWVRRRIEEVFATRPRDEWLERLAAAGVPSGPLLEREDWLDHPQIKAIGMRVELDDPERGRVVMPGIPIVPTATPGSVRSPAPRLGEHDGAVPPWPPRPAPAGTPRPAPGPLAGFRVLNLGAILAGPYAGHLLAELGAEVIKVEPPAGDAFRTRGFTYNRGMRGVALDLSGAPGQQAFYRMVERSDVVIDNYRPGVLEELRVDYDTLAGVKPDIITLSITGFGEGGPLSHLPGFDPILQAMSGMMTAQGGDDEPVFYTIAVNDVTAAAFSALAVCIALFHRDRARVDGSCGNGSDGEGSNGPRSGRPRDGASGSGDSRGGQRVWTSLAAMSAFMQCGELVRYPGRPAPPRGGRDYAGEAPLDRYYRVVDGWVRVSADGVDPEALVSAGLVAGARVDEVAKDPEAALVAGLAALPRDEAVRRLTAAGVPSAPARRVSELLRDEELAAAEVFHTHRRSDGTVYCTAGALAAFSRTQRRGVLEPPGLGEHTREVLLEAGLPEARVDDLLAGGVAVQGGPMEPRITVNYR